MRLRWMTMSALIGAVLSLGLAAGAARAEAERPRLDVDRLFQSLRVCQLFQLTSDGYLRAAASRFFVEQWDAPLVAELVRDARRRPALRIDLRSTVHLQVASASSYQAATAFEALRAAMLEQGAPHVSRARLVAAADAAFAARLEQDGLAGCFVIKWGNRHPDLLAQPLDRATWAAIRDAFAPGGADRFPESEAERALRESGRLNPQEIAELRAIRIAAYLFENAFEILRDDRGGFGGNLEDQPIVCTDEATTLWFFLDRLERAGLVKAFATQDGRFVHRRTTLILPSDHFGVPIKNLRTGEYFVIDSWVEDGGLPPHISRVGDWFDKGERRSVVGVGDAALDEALRLGRVTHRDANGLLSALRAHLAVFAPDQGGVAPDGRPSTCGFHWCGPPPLEAW